MTHNDIMNMMLLDNADYRTIDAVSQAVKERDAARSALTMLKKSIEQDPAMDTQVNNWMLGIIDTALGAGQ